MPYALEVQHLPYPPSDSRSVASYTGIDNLQDES